MLTTSGDYYLTANLTTVHGTDCPGDGLVIAADDISLDLHGFAIFGDGRGDGTGRTTSLQDSQGFFGDAGVRVLPGVTGFNIMGNAAVDCSDTAAARDSNANAIVGFDAGIRVERSPGTSADPSTIKQLHIRDNIGSLESDYGDGISIDNSSYITVGGSASADANCIRHNGFLSGVGVYEDPAFNLTNNITISYNTIVDNDINSGPVGAPGFSSQTDGVRLEPGVSDNLVANNVITRSGLDGVAIFPGSTDTNRTTGNKVRTNDITANGFHENVTDSESHIRNGPDGPNANSTAPGPTGYAQFTHRKGDGVRIFGGNLATGNTIGGPTSGTPGQGGTGQGNLICGNAASGIRVDGGARADTSVPPVFPTAHKNTIQNNTSGGGTSTPTPPRGCASNNVEVAPVPGAFDFYDGNTVTNSTAGHPPCSSNIWGDENSAVNLSLDNRDLDGVTPDADSTRNHTCIS